MQSRKSTVFILAGMFLMVFSALQPQIFSALLATIIVDTTPPTYGESTPIDQGAYGELSKVWIQSGDATSGVAIVDFWDSHTGATRALSLESGDRFSGVWSASTPIDWPRNTWISFKFTVTDAAQHQAVYSGSFKLLKLNGYWVVTDGVNTYRSDGEWSDIKFRKSMLTFSFVETAGAAVSVTVSYTQVDGSASGTVPMTRVEANRWEGSHTFHDGVYNIEMSASDGFNVPVTASIIQVGGGFSTSTWIRVATFSSGFLCAILGVVIRRRTR